MVAVLDLRDGGPLLIFRGFFFVCFDFLCDGPRGKTSEGSGPIEGGGCLGKWRAGAGGRILRPERKMNWFVKSSESGIISKNVRGETRRKMDGMEGNRDMDGAGPVGVGGWETGKRRARNRETGKRAALVKWGGCCLWMVFLVSCASTPHLETSAVLPFPPADQQIRLGPGDTLNIRFRYWPELDETQTVRPDGKITLQIVDDVAVTGMTPAELDQKLTELYSQSLKDPEITVIVRSYVSQRVYVGGEVRTPGLQPIQGDLDLLSAIIAAGGFINMSADKENVIVFRHVDTKRYAASINLQELMELPEADRILLAPNDIVYVGRLGIDEANQWVDQYIQRLIPGYNAALNALIYASLRN